MNVAIIPARGGSKRIPKKNIKKFAGMPMIYYAIKQALDSKIFSEVFVSTEDNEIAEIATYHGAKVPFLRTSSLSDDLTPTIPVISDAIKRLKDLKYEFDNVCCIYPCVPLLKKEDLIESYNLFNELKSNFCFPIVEFPSAIQRALKITKDNFVNPINNEYELVRTQDLEKTYYDAGQFYWGKADIWCSNDNLHRNASGYILPSWRVIDIDTEDDWLRAEIMHEIIVKSK